MSFLWSRASGESAFRTCFVSSSGFPRRCWRRLAVSSTLLLERGCEWCRKFRRWGWPHWRCWLHGHCWLCWSFRWGRLNYVQGRIRQLPQETSYLRPSFLPHVISLGSINHLVKLPSQHIAFNTKLLPPRKGKRPFLATFHFVVEELFMCSPYCIAVARVELSYLSIDIRRREATASVNSFLAFSILAVSGKSLRYRK